jgi:hypothetical protein
MEDMGWKLAYELQSCFSEVVRLVTDWATSDRDVLVHTLARGLQLVATTRRRGAASSTSWPIVAKHLTFLSGPRMYDVIDFDVAGEEVSLHVPLHRFLVPVLMSVPRYSGLAATVVRRIENEVSLMRLVEPVLHVMVAVAQINIGMWRRNGTMAESQVSS